MSSSSENDVLEMWVIHDGGQTLYACVEMVFVINSCLILFSKCKCDGRYLWGDISKQNGMLKKLVIDYEQ